MPRPGNTRLRRARYAELSGGPMKFGLAPTVGKGQHFWRLNRTGGGPKCCKPPLLPHSLELTFDASNGAILYVKFDYVVTTMTKLTEVTAKDTFKDQFKVRHEDTDNNDISFVNIKDMKVKKAYFNSSQSVVNSISANSNGKVGNYLVIELDESKPDHIPMLNENYVVEYTPGATKGYHVIMSGGDSGELPHSKQKGKASNSFDFKITDISGVTSLDPTADKQIAVTFSHDISNVGDISNAFVVTASGTTTPLTVSTAVVSNAKKVILTMSQDVTKSNKHTVTYNPLNIDATKQDTNYLKIHNANNVKNYRVPEVTKEVSDLN